MTESIENDIWRLRILPTLGASPIALEYRVGDAWHAVMRPTPAAALTGDSSSPFSSYTLAPYSNRIRDGKFSFQEREYTVRANTPKGEFIHGDVRNRAFQIKRPSASSLECAFDSRDVRDANFPFPYTLLVTYALEGDALLTTLTLENVGDAPMPAGFGLHPYFVRHFAGSTTDPTLTFDATGYYVTDEKTIPRDGARPLSPALDFSRGKSAYEQPLDTVFNGWNGAATLRWETHRLILHASDVFTHFVAFNGAPDATIALEPITHATDGFNLMARGVSDTGVRVLEAGERLRGTVTIRLEAV
ncbi:MAG: aldose 1-epimerase [Pleurocapsa sp. SU_196_0]|nr:aldose 1-epimerase [Pleurocapsa sp. SU_196_0]